jgi:hypothetical protein
MNKKLLLEYGNIHFNKHVSITCVEDVMALAEDARPHELDVG